MTGTGSRAIEGARGSRTKVIATDTASTSARVVILGGGFGGAYAAQALERTLRGTADVTLIDRQNFFVFYPLLVEAGTGTLEPRHAVVSIRSFLRHADFRMAEIIGVDFDHQRVQFCPGGGGTVEEIPYDHLVIALGSVPRLPDVPGLKEHGFQLKSLGDAVALRDRAIRMLELADAEPSPARRRAFLHLVVVGANFTGAEVAGEFDVFLRAASRTYRRVRPEDCRVTLVEKADRILGALEPDLSAYAATKMRQRGIDIRLGTSVKLVTSDQVTLTDGSVLEARTTIWCAGIAPSPLISTLPLPTDERGYILCDPDLRVKTFANVWAIGDCAINPDPTGRAYPATAQHAVRQAGAVARNIGRIVDGQDPVPYVHGAIGSLAALGCRTGVAKIFGVKLSGFAAWFLYRTVYLLKMPGWSRRIRIAIDWTMDLVFRRDYVQLQIHRK